MVEIFTIQTFASTFGPGMVTGGDSSITKLVDKDTNLELFTFDKKRNKR